MKRLIGLVAVTLLVGVAVVATTQTGEASDHDDGETDIKARSLNLTDHFAFKSADSPNDLTLIMYFNPRSLPGKAYFMSTRARYEFHVSKVADKGDQPTAADDFVFRFEAAAPDAAGAQAVTLTVLKDGAELGTQTGASTPFAASQAGTITTNVGTVGGIGVKYFIGQRADAFTFDVLRFFQVRAFLADRFFGKGTKGNNAAGLTANCKGQGFLHGLLVAAENDGDEVNLFNPPSCAPDFTKNYNVTAIVLNVPIANLGGGTVFDTWSTISVAD